MGVSPAEPLSDGTAEFALKLNKVGSMLRTLRCSNTEGVRGALSTDQLFWFELLCFLSINTILHSSEVRVLASMTEIVGALEDCPLL